MSRSLSYGFNTNRIQSRPYRQLLVGGLLAGLLTGCATSEPTASRLGSSQPAGDQSTAADTRVIDHSPIVAAAETDNSPEKQQHRPTNMTKEADMTVLVLDNPELMAKAAILDIGLGGPVGKVAEESARKPHRMRFHYGFNQHRLSDEDQQILRQHAAYLRAHPELTVEIHGHTDAFGNEEYNAFLARLRASSAAKLLQAEGVRESRITVTGWGSRKPLARPEDHAANRRLEIEYRSEQMAKAQ